MLTYCQDSLPWRGSEEVSYRWRFLRRTALLSSGHTNFKPYTLNNLQKHLGIYGNLYSRRRWSQKTSTLYFSLRLCFITLRCHKLDLFHICQRNRSARLLHVRAEFILWCNERPLQSKHTTRIGQTHIRSPPTSTCTQANDGERQAWSDVRDNVGW